MVKKMLKRFLKKDLKKNQIGYRFKKIKENINKSYIKSKGYGNLCNNWVTKIYHYIKLTIRSEPSS